MSNILKVSSNHRITLPADIRRRLGIKAGDQLVIDVQEGMMLLISVPVNYIDALAGRHSEIWDGIDTDAYLRQERDSWMS